MHSRYEYNRQWQLANPDKIAVSHKRYKAKHKDKVRDSDLQYKYGITLQNYNALFAKQNGLCLGCYKHQSQIKRSFVVDHNHSTKAVRGLLCNPCNLILGIANENPQTLERLGKYLQGDK